MKEHNNRVRAKQLAEYITGDALRRYVAAKVSAYCGSSPSIFDGAAGSGQLVQYLKPAHYAAVDIQAEACQVLRENYPAADIYNESFFNHITTQDFDCVVMNPPFSLKFGDLTERERTAVLRAFPWKKSGVLDDIFVLKALDFSKRFCFFILPAGVSYRKSEARMRETIGNRLCELNVVENGFDDTAIAVLFVVVDLQKTDAAVKKEIYCCRRMQVLHQETAAGWEMPRLPPPPRETVDIDEVNAALDKQVLKALESHLDSQLFIIKTFGAKMDYLGFIQGVRAVCEKYEAAYGQV